MSASTITVKLRDTRTSPPSTREFTLPVSRLILTSSYFRDHLREPLSRHRDGIFRLNFPDFQIFEIYAEWLRSGEIFTKAGLLHLHSPFKHQQGHQVRSPPEKARKAYTDYLGAWFLGSWMQDFTFKDALVSLMIDKMNGVEGYPREFVKALKPSLIDIVFEGSREGDPVRRFIFAAVARFGGREDIERFVPDKGRDQFPNEFIRGLMVYLHGLQSVPRSEEEEMEDDMGEQDSTVTDTTVLQSTATSTTTSHYPSTAISGSDVTSDFTTTTESWDTPPTFMGLMNGKWTPTSQVTWPYTSSESGVSSWGLETNNEGTMATSTSETAPSLESRTRHKQIIWPETPEEQCVFHEHTDLGEPCYRNIAR